MIFRLLPNPRRRNVVAAFSLVEVVFALAIFVFAGFSLVGLLALGLQDSSGARKRMEAATVAEMVCSIRRSAPTNDFSPTTSTTPNPQPGFPVPRLDLAANNLSPLVPVYVTKDGVTNTLAGADLGLLYSITPIQDASTHASAKMSTVYICLYWPPQASPTNASTGRYELTTSVPLP